MCVMPVGMGSTRGQISQGAGQHEAVGSPPVSPPGFAARGGTHGGTAASEWLSRRWRGAVRSKNCGPHTDPNQRG